MKQRGPFLTVRGLGRRYSGVVALHDVDLDVHHGEVIALVGKNGAGKSTFIKCLAGAVQADEGEVRVHGKPVDLSSPALANSHGLAFVHQELVDVPSLSVTENVLLGNGLPQHLGGFVDWKAAADEASAALRDLDPSINPRALVSTLSVAQRRFVMIAQALRHDAKLLVLDEPSAALSVEEIAHLHGIVRKLAERGVAVIYVSHRLAEVTDLTTRTVVMRDGSVVADRPTRQFDRASLIAEISGYDRMKTDADAAVTAPPANTGREPGEVLLQVEGLSREGFVDDATFSVRAGEILGIAGLVGAGRTELLRLIVGADRRSSGEIRVRGETVAMRSPREAARHGIVLLPEDRRSQGLVMGFSVRENITVTHLDQFRRYRRMAMPSVDRERVGARETAERLAIKATSVDVPVGQLSGGNQQKVVLGKWLGPGADVFMFDEPTAGIDVDGRGDTYEKLGELADDGKAVIVVSSDFSELPGLCDRVLIMADSRLVGELTGDAVTERALLAACFEGLDSSAARRGAVAASGPEVI